MKWEYARLGELTARKSRFVPLPEDIIFISRNMLPISS